MNFAASFNVNVTFDNPALLAGFVADFEKLYAKYNSGASTPQRQTQAANTPPATPQPLPPAPLSENESGSIFIETLVETPPVSAPAEPEAIGAGVAPAEKPKRTRATKAEMAARRAAAQQPDLPKPHGGSNTATLPPLTSPTELPSGDFTLPEGDCTADDLLAAFSNFMLEGCEGDLPGIFENFKITRVRDAKPEQFRGLCEAFARSIAAKKASA